MYFANIIPPVVSEGGGLTTIIFSTVTALLTIATSFLFSRRKQRTDDFAAFMEESADFREEIRKELKRKQDDYDKEISHQKSIIAEKEMELVELRKHHEDYIVHYKYISDYMPQLLWTALPSGEINYYNTRWYEYTGMSLDQAQGWGWTPMVHPDDLETTELRWKDAIRRTVPLELTIRLRKGSDGSFRWFLCRTVPRFDSNGRVVQWIGTATDIENILVKS